MPPDSAPPPALLAAVDLGSNSFRLEVGRVEGDQVLRQDAWRDTVRLAAGLDASGTLDGAAVDRALDCLHRFNERLRGFAPEAVRAVGTNTLRVARNAKGFLRKAERALGFPIEVIAGREEARLIYQGVAHTLPPSDRGRLVVDVGGGSTELIVGRGLGALRVESVAMGCVTYTRRFFDDGAITAKAFQRAEVAARSGLEEMAAGFDRRNWDEAFGSSGTVGAIAGILEANGWDRDGISLDGMQRLRARMIDAGHVRRLALKSLREDRAPVLAAGLAVVLAVFRELGVERMRVAGGALRLGVLYDLLGRRLHRDVRDATIDRLQARFGVDRAQAARVREAALALLAALRPGADEASRRLLAWAADVHESGFALSHHEWHKHSAYIVGNADMPGFSTGDQQRLSALLLGQRGNLKKLGEWLEDPALAAMVLCLRLALVLCHARRDLPAPRMDLRLDRSVRVAVEATWLDAHPLTAHLLAEEAQHWADAGMEAKVVAR